MQWILIWSLAAYLLGAIPVAWCVGRLNGIDIRQVGSGNVGATNVFRTLGKGWGILTFATDVAKGVVPASLFPLWSPETAPANLALWYGALAVVGHNWPVYLRFKGGKGVATSAGVLLAVAPLAVGLGLASWVILFLALRYVSVASIGAALMVVISGLGFYGVANPVLAGVLLLLGTLVIIRHRSNIQRLQAGTEPRSCLFKSDKKESTA